MASTIKIKRSAVPSSAPTTSNLELGELAINTYDGKLYLKKNVSGTESVVEVGAGGGGGGSGTVTSITAGTGLSGGTITTTGTIAIDGTVATLTGTQTLTNKTLTNITLSGSVIEGVYTITDGESVDLDPTNGTIQVWSLGAARTATASSFAAGESMTLMIADGAGYALTFPTITWANATPPTLSTTGYTVLELWKVGSTLYGAVVGDVA